MTNSESNEWICSANFEEAFTELIAGDNFFNFVSYDLTSDKHWSDFAARFPDTQATPFRRELRRWIKKAAPHRIKSRSQKKRQEPCYKNKPSFHGTIKNLEIYCKLFKQTPNQVLGIATPGNQGSKLRFLTEEDIETICCIIKQYGEKFINVKWPVLLPVEFDFETFSMMYLKIYKSRPDNKVFTITYLACDLNRAYPSKDKDDVIFEGTATTERSSTKNTFFEKDINCDYNEAIENIVDLKRYSRSIPTFTPEGKPSFSAILEECLRTKDVKIAGDFFEIFSCEPTYDDSEDEVLDAVEKAKHEAGKRNTVP